MRKYECDDGDDDKDGAPADTDEHDDVDDEPFTNGDIESPMDLCGCNNHIVRNWI